jgi:hypothetical protein
MSDTPSREQQNMEIAALLDGRVLDERTRRGIIARLSLISLNGRSERVQVRAGLGLLSLDQRSLEAARAAQGNAPPPDVPQDITAAEAAAMRRAAAEALAKIRAGDTPTDPAADA